MRQVFISYARDDHEAVEALAARLRRLVDSVWFDSQLHGGEDWWAGILERIRGCDVFLVQPTGPPVNDNLMELLTLIDACARASAV